MLIVRIRCMNLTCELYLNQKKPRHMSAYDGWVPTFEWTAEHLAFLEQEPEDRRSLIESHVLRFAEDLAADVAR